MTLPQRSESLWLILVRLLRWDKPEGRLILLIPALWAVFLAARGAPPLPLVGVIVLGTLATSAGGCIVNDLWDRDIDPKVQRTRNRPLAARSLSVTLGLIVALVAFLCAWGLSLYLNPFTFWLCIAAVPVIVLYPGAKRVFPVPQLVLAIAWGFAVLISWSAVSCGSVAAATPCLGQATWLLWSATVLWTLGFDTIYALSDREDDRRIGINSSALFFGKFAPHAIGLLLAGSVGMLAGVGWVMGLKLGFWVGLGLAAIAWAWQYSRLCQRALPNSVYAHLFKQNVWIGFVLLLGMILGVRG
ncbi:MAG TPA: 4-hydroxybenzoate solanesyltransferase [Thermosynechococcaceae cyanobacterium]